MSLPYWSLVVWLYPQRRTPTTTLPNIYFVRGSPNRGYYLYILTVGAELFAPITGVLEWSHVSLFKTVDLRAHGLQRLLSSQFTVLKIYAYIAIFCRWYKNLQSTRHDGKQHWISKKKPACCSVSFIYFILPRLKYRQTLPHLSEGQRGFGMETCGTFVVFAAFAKAQGEHCGDHRQHICQHCTWFPKRTNLSQPHLGCA